MPEVMIGKEIENYRITRLIGGGGMAVVYEAKHVITGWLVAIKIIRPNPNRSPEEEQRYRQQFEIEARLAQALAKGQEGLVNVHGFGYYHDNQPYIIMEYLTGYNLRQLINRHKYAKEQLGHGVKKPLDLTDIIGMMIKICRTLDHIHRKKIEGKQVVHRDIKPDNIMFRTNYEDELDYLKPVIMDLGVAELIGASQPFGGGTPGYAAPEMLLHQPVDCRADIYAAGIVLFELCTGRLPFDGANLITETKETNPPPPSQFEVNISPTLEKIILKALEKDPDQRFATAIDMQRALETLGRPKQIASTSIRLFEVSSLDTPPGPEIKHGPDVVNIPSPVKQVLVSVIKFSPP